jgi:hypothetical protein
LKLIEIELKEHRYLALKLFTMTIPVRIITVILGLMFPWLLSAQTITGVWRGKIKGAQAEVKLVKSGDNLVGVAYYYQNKNRYKRYSVKGHFDPNTNAVIWWDELLLEEMTKSRPLPFSADPEAQLMVADFNCPGADEMYLDGTSSSRDNKQKQNGNVHLVKMDKPLFRDEWDFIIDNYFVGGNDPQLIDSVRLVAVAPMPEEPKGTPEASPARPPVTAHQPTTVPAVTAPGSGQPSASIPPSTTEPVAVAAPPVSTPVPPAPIVKAAPPANEIKFSSRKNVLQTVIPITAKTIELRFYDNAQVDGDSIALFLNGKMLLQHIRLTEQPYIVKLDASELGDDNELVMVAENLGSIPPNTSFMVAEVGDKRYEARLFANENSSALIRIVRPAPKKEE